MFRRRRRIGCFEKETAKWRQNPNRNAGLPSVMQKSLDALDHHILQALQQDGRQSWQQLATTLGVSAPTVRDRVRRLEDIGVIDTIAATLSPKALGYSIEAIVRFKVFTGMLHRLAEQLVQTDQVIQCDKVTGEDAFIARILLRDMAELDILLDRFSAYASTQTSIVKSSLIPLRPPPLP